TKKEKGNRKQKKQWQELVKERRPIKIKSSSRNVFRKNSIKLELLH
ncbi:4082_t:CDS:1, partial [Cetraspora pellucida]